MAIPGKILLACWRSNKELKGSDDRAESKAKDLNGTEMLCCNGVDHIVEFSYILPLGDNFGRGEELF